MDREWWVSLIQWILWGLMMAVVMGWVAKSRQRLHLDSERYTLRHPVSTLVTGVVGTVFFFGLTIISNTIGKNSTTTVWTTFLFIAFGLASLTMVMDYFFARHRVSEQGIEYGRMFGQRGSFQWREVQTVSFSPSMKWFILETSSGTKVRVSALLTSLPEFAHFVLLYVPKQAIEPDTQAVLQETAQGRLPSV